MQDSPVQNHEQEIDLLVLGADVVTYDAARTTIRDGAIAVDSGRIAWLGPSSEARQRFTARQTITASEIGFSFGLDKPVWGPRTDFRRTGENPGAVVNLQVQYWIESSGGAIARTVEALIAALRSNPQPRST